MADLPRRPLLRRLVGVAFVTGALALGPAAPAAVAMHPGRVIDTHTWKGHGRTLHSGDRVAVAGTSFNRFLKRTLEGPDSACADSSAIVLKRFRSDGFAWMPRLDGSASPASSAPCAEGRSFAVAVRDNRRWSVPAELTGAASPAQAPLRCTDLSSYSVPPAIYRRDCTVRNGTPVPYRAWFWNKVDDQGRWR